MHGCFDAEYRSLGRFSRRDCVRCARIARLEDRYRLCAGGGQCCKYCPHKTMNVVVMLPEHDSLIAQDGVGMKVVSIRTIRSGAFRSSPDLPGEARLAGSCDYGLQG